MFLQIFKRITSHEYKEFTPSLSVVSIFQQTFLSQSLVDLSIFLHDISKKKKKRQKPTTYVSNNDHIPVMKLIRELYESLGSSPQRQLQAEQEMQYFVEFALRAKIAFPRLI